MSGPGWPANITTTADEAVIVCAVALAERGRAAGIAAVIASSAHLQASARNVAALGAVEVGVFAAHRHAADVAAVVLGLRFRLSIAGEADRYFAGEPAGDVGGLLDVAAWDDCELNRDFTIRDLLTGRAVTAADFDGAGFLRDDEAGDLTADERRRLEKHLHAAAPPQGAGDRQRCVYCGRADCGPNGGPPLVGLCGTPASERAEAGR